MTINETLFNVNQLTPMQLGRLKKSLSKVYRFPYGLSTVHDHLVKFTNDYSEVTKTETNNLWKWDRRRFNNMDGDQQKNYERKLEEGRTYYISNNDFQFNIPKIVFDVLNVPVSENS